MIERELYMKQIRPFMNRPFVKVIAGIRWCGKSVVLQLIEEELERQEVAKEHHLKSLRFSVTIKKRNGFGSKSLIC